MEKESGDIVAVGDIVLFMMPNGKARPFLVQDVDAAGSDSISGILFAFPPDDRQGMTGIGNVHHSELKAPGTWHFRPSNRKILTISN